MGITRKSDDFFLLNSRHTKASWLSERRERKKRTLRLWGILLVTEIMEEVKMSPINHVNHHTFRHFFSVCPFLHLSIPPTICLIILDWRASNDSVTTPIVKHYN